MFNFKMGSEGAGTTYITLTLISPSGLKSLRVGNFDSFFEKFNSDTGCRAGVDMPFPD